MAGSMIVCGCLGGAILSNWRLQIGGSTTFWQPQTLDWPLPEDRLQFLMASFFATRVALQGDPFSHDDTRPWTQRGVWPAAWISRPESAPFVAAFRLQFALQKPEIIRLHVSADERYELFCDGVFVGRGSERGDGQCWFFESFDFGFEAGNHCFVAKVWALGEGAPFAQMSVAPGFLMAAQQAQWKSVFSTGFAPWESQLLGGHEWKSPLCAWGTGWNQRVFGARYPWGFESGAGEGWQPCPGETAASASSLPRSNAPLKLAARAGAQPETTRNHALVPAMLPPMLNQRRSDFLVRHVCDAPIPTASRPILESENLIGETQNWQDVFAAKPLEIAAHTARRVLVDLRDYFCGRFEIVTSGGHGALVRVHFAESLYDDVETWSKGQRDEIEGKFFAATWSDEDGVGDEFWPDGGDNRRFEPLWWQAGRYVEIAVQTQSEPLILQSLALLETRYPLEMESHFQSDDARLETLIPMMTRALQMCAHETYMDCPYYEQLMYVGDTRLECLVTYALTRDEALPKKALRIFEQSRLRNGLTQSRYPSRVRQIIPPFSLWWVCMAHDYALWRGDGDFVRSLLPTVRGVCDYFWSLRGENGLMSAPDGWNYVDWVKTTEAQLKYGGGDPKWRDGCAPDAAIGVSGVLNWQAVLCFKAASDLENWFGEGELEQLQKRRAQLLADSTERAFWNPARGLYCDDLRGENFSEHAQCLAITSGFVPDEKRETVAHNLMSAPDLARATIYFSHYLLETFRVLNRADKFFERLESWHDLKRDGLKTTIEMPEPTRSDCHAWGAHPLFHFFATLAGIRPVAPAFSKVEVRPMMGHLKSLHAILPHPLGEIEVKIENGVTQIRVPDGVELV